MFIELYAVSFFAHFATFNLRFLWYNSIPCWILCVSALKRQHFRHSFGIFSGKHAPFLLFSPKLFSRTLRHLCLGDTLGDIKLIDYFYE